MRWDIALCVFLGNNARFGGNYGSFCFLPFFENVPDFAMISKVSEFVLKILGLGILSLCDGSDASCELVSTMKTNLQGWQGNLIS